MTEIEKLVSEIDAIVSLQSEEDIARLHHLADSFFSHSDASKYLETWFRLYERCEEDDAWDVYWSIMHGLEDHPGIEHLVLQSLRRKPARFPVLMMNRLINGGVSCVEGASLLTVLEMVARDESCPAIVRQDATQFLEYQQGIR